MSEIFTSRISTLSRALAKTQQRFVVLILDVLEEHNKSSGKAGSAPQARN